MNYVNGKVIKRLREEAGYTQKELAEILCVSDKTISKWEAMRGLPDITVLPELSAALHVSVPELLAGEQILNKNRSADMKKLCFYVCPVCGNIIQAAGEGMYSCCGIQLPVLKAEENEVDQKINVEIMENEYYVTVKLYPEQDIQVRFARRSHGTIYAYCNRHGLNCVKV